MTKTHYEILGVLPNASADEIRVAYRMRVREVHPDSSVGKSADASQRMAEISKAWEVLQDRGLRAQYDRSLLVGAPISETRYEAPVFIERGAFPWRMVGSLTGIGIAVVLLINILSDPVTPSGPDGLISGGSCVVIDANQLANEVPCDQQHYGVARTLVGFDMTCPTDTEPYRDRQGMGIACVDPA